MFPLTLFFFCISWLDTLRDSCKTVLSIPHQRRLSPRTMAARLAFTDKRTVASREAPLPSPQTTTGVFLLISDYEEPIYRRGTPSSGK